MESAAVLPASDPLAARGVDTDHRRMLDRFLTVNLIAPLRRVYNARSAPLRIPILMYHAVTDEPEPGVRGYYRLNTPPALFRRHLQILKDESFAIVDLRTAVDHLAARSASSHLFPSQRFAVITFDDGFRDFYTHAAPTLADFGFPATNFIIAGSVGKEFKGRQCMSWSELRELASAGLSFGSHTVTHPKLWELDAAALERELVDSRRAIEQELDEPVDTFAHPFAFPRTNVDYVRRFRDALAGAGYRLGVTTSLGCAAPADDELTLKRLPANGADDDALFRAKLGGAYDWLATPQTVFKRLKLLRAS